MIRPGIVHRLDKGTTGLMVAAKDERTLTGLAAQFKAHTVQRVYHAIVLGVPKEAEGVIETNIGRDIRDRKKMGVFSYMSSRRVFSAIQCCRSVPSCRFHQRRGGMVAPCRFLPFIACCMHVSPLTLLLRSLWTVYTLVGLPAVWPNQI